jgi:hypothetical protein
MKYYGMRACLAAVLACAVVYGAYAETYDWYLDGKNIPQPYPELTNGGVGGCHDPANTIVWMDIVSGLPRTVQEGVSTRTVLASRGRVWNERREFLFRPGCHEFAPSGPANIVAIKTWYGVDMFCVSPRSLPPGPCYWLPSAAFTSVPRP